MNSNPYTLNPNYLLNPFNALYQDNTLLSNKPEIQELNQYAIDLEDQIEGDFNLNYLTFEFAYNQLGFVRNGLLLAKLKFLKLYKNYGDGTFASFCKYQLRKQRWQINDTIKASRVVLDLMYAGFEILPANIAQAVALAKLTIDELIEKWRSIIETLPPDKITAHSIRNIVKPPTESSPAVASLEVPAKVHEEIHREAANRGLSIGEFIKIILGFFLKSENSHLLSSENNTEEYRKKERIWQQDLDSLVAESDNFVRMSQQTESFT
jgi:hypothetical protein